MKTSLGNTRHDTTQKRCDVVMKYSHDGNESELASVEPFLLS